MSERLIELRDVRLHLGVVGLEQIVFACSELSVVKGEKVALIGPSGCGKSTLLHLIVGLLQADDGLVSVDGVDLKSLSVRQMDRFRGANMGVVFQSLNLLEGFSALENILIGMRFGRSLKKNEAKDQAMALLERVGLANRALAKVDTLSGGELQRVAVARAMANSPKVILADEPTGSLDPKSSEQVFELICSISEELGCSLLFVTHDHTLSSKVGRTFDCMNLIQHKVS